MKKIIIILVLLATLIPVQKVEAETMDKLLLVPVYDNPAKPPGDDRGPKYFCWIDGDTDCIQNYTGMDYGFVDAMLLRARTLSQAELDFLSAQPDVFIFPDNLDQPIPPNTVNVYFESIYLPADWLTPSTSYRELIRFTIGILQFNQKYAGIAATSGGGRRSIFENGRTLESNWNNLSAQEKDWFNQTVQFFQPGAPGVTGNPKLRSLAKQAGDLWGARPVIVGGITL